MSDSPCNGVCQLHPSKGLCLGCGRTGEEIGAWAGLRRKERLAIMTVLPDRMRKAGLTPAQSGEPSHAP